MEETYEESAVNECSKMGIPTVCVIDTDADPENVDIAIEYFKRRDDAAAGVVVGVELGGVATDGSCDQHPIRALRRAGWARVEVDDLGKTVSAAYGSVPSGLPQTSRSAEYAAMTCTAHLATAPCHVFSDCSKVVKDWQNNGSRTALSSNSTKASMLLFDIELSFCVLGNASAHTV